MLYISQTPSISQHRVIISLTVRYFLGYLRIAGVFLDLIGLLVYRDKTETNNNISLDLWEGYPWESCWDWSPLQTQECKYDRQPSLNWQLVPLQLGHQPESSEESHKSK